jgi:hypothetical protein
LGGGGGGGGGGRRDSYIAIVTFYRRLDVVQRMLRALTSQSVPPAEIWVTMWNSPHEEEIRALVDEFRHGPEHLSRGDRDRNNRSSGGGGGGAAPVPIKLVGGDVNLKYYGRFQVWRGEGGVAGGVGVDRDRDRGRDREMERERVGG